MITMHLILKEVTLTIPNQIVNNSVSRAVAHSIGILDDDSYSSSLQKWTTEIAYMFLGEITLALEATTSVNRLEEAS